MKKIIFICLILNLSFKLLYSQVTDSVTLPKIKVSKHSNLSTFVASMRAAFSNFDSTQVETGILYDNVILPFSSIEKYNGSDTSKAISIDEFKQICFELDKANLKKKKFRIIDSIEPKNKFDSGLIPLTLINYNYQKIKDDAIDKGLIQNINGKYIKMSGKKESPFITKKVFSSIAMVDHTFTGKSVKFRINKNAYFTKCKEKLKNIQINFDNGNGFQNVEFNQDIPVSYQTEGTKTITVKVTDENNATLTSSSLFSVQTPIGLLWAHTDMSLTADIAYNGVYASGIVSLFKSPVTSNDVRNPIIFLEGLDVNNTLDAIGLYQILSGGNLDPTFIDLGWPNGPDLAQCLLNNGYDILIVKYDDTKTYIQANAMLVVKVIQYVNQLKAGKNSNILVGASMGGLVGRYALSYMETNILTTGDHQTRLFVSYDSPQKGANIPLGDQYWIDFFAAANNQAFTTDAQLNSISPRQMLVYHHLDFPYSDYFRTTFVNELSNLGYPQTCRNIAITNGSANGSGETYSPGDQLVSYRYRSFSVNIDGNSWAVPNSTPLTQIAECAIDAFGFYPVYNPDLTVSVSGTLPYDNAPGGMRATNLQIANSPTSDGHISTNNPTHCFIPTISALDINTSDLFYNISGDQNILSKTPFKAIYYPVNNASDNQPHVYITSETVNWIMNELVPDNIVLDGTTRNVGDIIAKNSIIFLPGFHADGTSMLNAKIGSYTQCDLTPSSMNSPSAENNNTPIGDINTSKPSLVSDFVDKSKINIYPNPSNGNFTIVMPFIEKAAIEVYNSTGVLLFNTNSNSNIAKIDLSRYSNGIYTLKINYSIAEFVSKIIIIK